MKKQTIDFFCKSFQDQKYNLCIYGSEKQNEIDILVFENSDSFFISQPIKTFILKLEEFSKSTKANIIVYHEHRALIPKTELCFHLVYYPSVVHFCECELPSFISYIYSAAKFVHGSSDLLKNYAKSYFKRKIYKQNTNLFLRHLYTYDRISINSLIYNTIQSKVYPLGTIHENLTYSLRFLLAEYFHELQYSLNYPLSWNWDTIISKTKENFPKNKGIINLLKQGMEHNIIADSNLTKELFFKYFDLRDSLIMNLKQKGCLK